MIKEKITIKYDDEGDFLEIYFEDIKEGYYKEIKDKCFERLDKETNKVVGYSIFSITKRKQEIKMKEFSIKYNEEGDFLELDFKKSKDTHFKEVKKNISEIIENKTEIIIGYIVSNFTKRKQNIIDIELPISKEILA